LLKYSAEHIEDILQKYAFQIVESGLVLDLISEYPELTHEFTKAFEVETISPSITFHAVLLYIGADEKIRKRLVKNISFMESFGRLLYEPTQDDFYGTEGWEHFLGLD